MINKKIIYFPYINLNANNLWYRAATLYWDKIQILSHDFSKERDIPFEGETLKLFDKGQIEPLYVSEHLEDEFITSFLDYTSSQKLSKSEEPILCFKGKFKPDLVKGLKKQGFLEETEGHYSVQGTVGKLYLSLVAHKSSLVSDYDLYTDDLSHLEYLNYGKPIGFSKKIARKKEFVSACLNEILPIPRDEVNVEELIEFKDKYKEEYIQFRNFIERRFVDIQEIDSMSDEEFEKMASEMIIGTRDMIMEPIQKAFKKVVNLTIPLIDFKLGGPLFSILKEIGPKNSLRGNSYRYLALVNNNLS